MRRLAGAALLLTLAACGGGRGSGGGSDNPILGPGLYTFSVDASSVCRLPVSHFEWQLEATANSNNAGTSVRATLPGGDASVNVSLATAGGGRGSTGSSSAVTGSISTRAVPQADNTVRVTVNGSLTGQLMGSGGARGSVQGGDLGGTIVLTSPDRNQTPLGNCTAANHRWNLAPN
jgi:hypothetical protein